MPKGVKKYKCVGCGGSDTYFLFTALMEIQIGTSLSEEMKMKIYACNSCQTKSIW